MTNWVGTPIRRIDVVDRVTGTAIYGADIKLPGMLYGKTLHSPYAHARIISIKTDQAEKLPGVVAIATGSENDGLIGEALQDMPLLARERVRFIGDPVVAVAATSESIAEQALGLIQVEYEELPAVFEPLDAMREGAPIIHEKLNTYHHIPVVQPVPGTNILGVCEWKSGDVQKGFEESDLVFEDIFYAHAGQHAQIEPHWAIALWSGKDRVTLWSPTNGPHRLRKDFAEALGIPTTHVRVIVPCTGGNFGGKSGPKVECIAVALARKTKGRPVRVVFTREEVFTASRTRHAAMITIKTGVQRNGTLVAREVVGYWDTGAYADRGPTVVRQGTMGAMGPYRIPNVRVVGYCVYTNKIPAAGLRGYGTPQPTFSYESQMDIIAHKLGMDPLEFRLKNALQEGDTIPSTGQLAHSVGVKECLSRVAAELKWGEPSGPNRAKGIACSMKPTKTPSGSSAIVLLNESGTVNVLTSSVEQGQGVKTVLAQMVAEELGLAVECIAVSDPDTDFTPYDASSSSSRSTFHMGNAVCLAARDLKAQLAKEAAPMLGCSQEEIVVSDGRVSKKGDPGKALGYNEVVKKRYGAGGTLIGHGFYYPPKEVGTGSGVFGSSSAFWMYVASGVEVEVDPETGQIHLLKLVAGPDVGKAINPLTLSGQIEGGTVQGMSTALFEEIKMENGRILNANFTDYKVATAADVPEVVPLFVEAAHKDGPFGAKGMGEPIISPVAPAIANAIYNAIGVRIKDNRLSPERVLKAIRNKTG